LRGGGGTFLECIVCLAGYFRFCSKLDLTTNQNLPRVPVYQPADPPLALNSCMAFPHAGGIRRLSKKNQNAIRTHALVTLPMCIKFGQRSRVISGKTRVGRYKNGFFERKLHFFYCNLPPPETSYSQNGRLWDFL